ncbi:MAG: HD domain-containing protein [Nanoarchaeota archaeon]|nr:HD domain-containing protein [Nanoarchaeota archaeon]
MVNGKIIERLNPEVRKVFEKAKPYLKESREGDIEHVYFMLETILNLKQKKVNIDLSIMLPLAILHDIGHCGVLPEHFKYLTGSEKIKNAKLVHMLTGAKIAKKILEESDYDPEKSKEIIEIVSMHDAGQVEGMGLEAYNTPNKKIFHDLDRIGGLDVKRIRIYLSKYVDKNKIDKIREEFVKSTKGIFHKEFQETAKEMFKYIDKLFDEKRK